MIGIRAIFLVIGTLGLFLISGCDSAPPDGPTEVRWDKDICERCRMLLSDRKYAAQYLDTKGKYHLFDDPGEMFLTFQEKFPGDSKIKLYVTDSETGKWLKARAAYYTEGHLTPMGFGYGAHEENRANSMDFDTVLKKLLAGEKGAPTPHMQHQHSMPTTHEMLQSH